MRQVGELEVCAALDTDTLKCTLHPAWPTSCERFPYSLNVARRQVHWGTRCPSKPGFQCTVAVATMQPFFCSTAD